MDVLKQRWSTELRQQGLITGDITRVTTSRGAVITSPFGLTDGEVLFCWCTPFSELDDVVGPLRRTSLSRSFF